MSRLLTNQDIFEDVCNALRIPIDQRNIISIELSISVGVLPTVKIERFIYDDLAQGANSESNSQIRSKATPCKFVIWAMDRG